MPRNGTDSSRSSVGIVTPWRGNPHLADDYFAAVEAAEPDQVVIVDDGSEPSLEWAAVRLDEPSGFSTASNAGLAIVETEYVVFLNNDVSLLRPSWLDEIRAVVEPGVIVGPICDNHYCVVDDVAYPYVDGWCLAMATEDARRLGGWDEGFDVAGPAYYSDTWLAFHARMNGMRLRHLRPGLQHKGGQTGGVDRGVFEHALETNAEIFKAQVREAVAA